MSSVICKAILFDMDGTLIESSTASEVTWRVWAKAHQIDIEKIRAVHHGRRPEETIALVAPELDAAREAQFIYNGQEKVESGIFPIDGVKEFYSSLPPNSFGIVTAASQSILERRFRIVGLEPPPICITAQLLKVGKPDPEGYLMGARNLGIDPKDCLVFEDAPAGLLAANRAGMRSIAVTTNYSEQQLQKELGNDYHPLCVISNYQGLTVDLGEYSSERNLKLNFPNWSP